MAAHADMAAPQHDIRALLDLGDTAPLYVTGLALDSRNVRPGDAFVAVSGATSHGLDHVDSALRAGASAVLVDSDDVVKAESSTPTANLVAVPGLREKLPTLARAVFGGVDLDCTLCGVTGTDGKTSTSLFLAQLLNTDDAPCAVLGTVGNGLLGQLETATHTTPDVLATYSALREFVDQGAQYVAMEVSSHALDQARVGGLRFKVGALTNLGRDHLDYHGTLEHYADAKRKLFRDHADQWVLNLDDVVGQALFAESDSAVGFSIDGNPAARWQGGVLACDSAGMQCQIRVGNAAPQTVYLSLLGRFNLANVLTACAMAESVGLPADTVLGRVEKLEPVVGRLESLQCAGVPSVVIDYAHTEQALASAIAALREHVSGTLWCVFGCGGDRDRGKRAGMARAACAADRVVLTSDNPRSESPAAIAKDAAEGLVPGHAVDTILDRADAIAFALANADPSDCVLIAGKGHEAYQEINGQRIAFSDHEVVRSWCEVRT